jgi:hypothetical protein
MGSPKNDTSGAVREPFEAARWLKQMTGSWQTMAAVWTAWLDAGAALSRERGVEISKSLIRLLDPQVWSNGGLAPWLEELQDQLTPPKLADMPTVELSMLPSAAAILDLAGLMQKT